MTHALVETPLGTLKIEFKETVAPKHVQNFIALAKEGFYDGTAFHRVIPGFMIQGGDPNSRLPDRRLHGTGGSGKNVKAEFSKEPHKRGAVSMARSQNPDSASSQFFICVDDAPHLDGQYSLFGQVTEGIEVVDKIVAVETDFRDNPNEAIPMKVVIVES